MLLAPIVAELGGPDRRPADYFAIMVLAFIAVTSVLGSSRVRGLASLGLGLTIGLIGIDPTTGQQRLTFGIPELADGIDVVVVAVGLFAVGEALWMAAHLRRRPIEVIPVGNPRMSREDWRRSWKPWLRGTAIGFPFGAIPAGGAEIPTFLSYVTEKRLSKHPEEFGKGAIEGVAGPEATNNASAAGGLVPLLTLGIPTTATAAVMLAAISSYGIQPGPRLFATEPELVWGLIASLFIGNTVLLVLNLPLAPVWAKLLRIPRPYLYAGILFFASLGAYATNASTFDLFLLLIIGALGFMMRRYGLPLLPAIIGVILGPFAEEELRRALQISNGDLSGLIEPVLDRRLRHRRAGPVVADRPQAAAPQGRSRGTGRGRARDRGGPPPARADRGRVGRVTGGRVAVGRVTVGRAEASSRGRVTDPGTRRRPCAQVSCAHGLRSVEQQLQVARVGAGAVADAGHERLQPGAGPPTTTRGAGIRTASPDRVSTSPAAATASTATEPSATGSPATSASRPIAGGPPSRPV